jgi:N-acetylmuramoyl-L-alanine amidase
MQLSRHVLGVTLVLSLAHFAQALPPPEAVASNERSPRITSRRATAVTSQDAPVRSNTVVVIDAGHGGFDRGGIPGQRVPESIMTLDVAQRLRSILQTNGYKVVMTRSTDVFVPLGTRVAIANSYRNAIFVCIHFNSATRRGANGIETYFYGSQSLPLASSIHYYVAGGAASPNRGVRRRGFYVLRKTTIPAVLVECGFLTNPMEAQTVQNSGYRQRLAEEIAHGVRSRGSVANSRVTTSPSDSEHLETNATVPLQPFIDQTRFHDPDLARSRHRKGSKSSSSSKSKKKKSSDSASGTKKKKKPAPKTTED